MNMINNLSIESEMSTGEYDITKRKTSSDKTFSISGKPDSSNPLARVIGMTSVAVSSMHSYIVSAEISDDSTDDDPVVSVRCPDKNGQYYDRKIHVNDVNPSNATDMEIFAYLSWNDHIGNRVPGSISSWSCYRAQQMTASGIDNSPEGFMNAIHNAYEYIKESISMLSKINHIDAKRLAMEGQTLIKILDDSKA